MLQDGPRSAWRPAHAASRPQNGCRDRLQKWVEVISGQRETTCDMVRGLKRAPWPRMAIELQFLSWADAGAPEIGTRRKLHACGPTASPLRGTVTPAGHVYWAASSAAGNEKSHLTSIQKMSGGPQRSTC